MRAGTEHHGSLRQRGVHTQILDESMLYFVFIFKILISVCLQATVIPLSLGTGPHTLCLGRFPSSLSQPFPSSPPLSTESPSLFPDVPLLCCILHYLYFWTSHSGEAV